jgi:hypothetical protein
MCFRILSLISILAGVISFALFLAGTLGSDALGIRLSIVAVWIGSTLVLWGCAVTLGAGVSSRSSVSIGALAASSKVTLRSDGCGVGTSVAGSGSFVRIASNLLSASICSNPFSLLFPFNACVRSFSAFDTMSALVKVGCVMYFVLKNTVSDTRSLLVCLT